MTTSTVQNGEAAEGTQPKRRPVEVIQRYIGGGSTIKIAIFDKKISTPGRNGVGVFTMTTFFCTVSKSWKRDEPKDGESRWANSSAFNPHELLELADALNEAHARCRELHAKANISAPVDDDIPF